MVVQAWRPRPGAGREAFVGGFGEKTLGTLHEGAKHCGDFDGNCGYMIFLQKNTVQKIVQERGTFGDFHGILAMGT